MLERIYIIAGNMRQYDDFVTRWNRVDGAGHRFIYVSQWRDLIGIKEPRIFLYGTYYLRRDWEDLHAYLNSHEARVTKVP